MLNLVLSLQYITNLTSNKKDSSIFIHKQYMVTTKNRPAKKHEIMTESEEEDEENTMSFPKGARVQPIINNSENIVNTETDIDENDTNKITKPWLKDYIKEMQDLFKQKPMPPKIENAIENTNQVLIENNTEPIKIPTQGELFDNKQIITNVVSAVHITKGILATNTQETIKETEQANEQFDLAQKAIVDLSNFFNKIAEGFAFAGKIIKYIGYATIAIVTLAIICWIAWNIIINKEAPATNSSYKGKVNDKDLGDYFIDILISGVKEHFQSVILVGSVIVLLRSFKSLRFIKRII